MNTYLLTLIYSDGTQYVLGSLPDLDSCNAWIAKCKTGNHPRWTAIQITTYQPNDNDGNPVEPIVTTTT